MAVNIELKRSAVPGKVPTTSSLSLGEIALNTYDGKAYFKKDTGTQYIIELASTSGSIASASFATSALYATTSSYAVTSSYAFTASYVLNAISASYAATASYADNFTVAGTLTAQTIIAQYITSSTQFITGSTKFGTLLTNTHQFTGSVTVTGSLAVNGSNVVLTNQTASMSVLSSSYALTTTTASYALTASSINFDIFRIATGSVTASVSTNPSNLFLIKSGSSDYFKIASTETTLYSDLFIIKNFTTQQAVLSVSQSVVQFATQSLVPVGTTPAGGIWFTSTALYVGLD